MCVNGFQVCEATDASIPGPVASAHEQPCSFASLSYIITNFSPTVEIKFGMLWISVTTAKFYPNKDILQSEMSLGMFNIGLCNKAPGLSSPEGVCHTLAGEAGGCCRWSGFP